MRRAVVILLGALALLFAVVPAIATESTVTEDEATEQGEGHGATEDFGEGEWDGLIAAAAVAGVFGLIVFAFSNVGVKDEPSEDAHH